MIMVAESKVIAVEAVDVVVAAVMEAEVEVVAAIQTGGVG